MNRKMSTLIVYLREQLKKLELQAQYQMPEDAEMIYLGERCLGIFPIS